MTARVTTLKGPDAGAYYVDGPGGYYLGGDEPPGRWLGLGAEALGLAGVFFRAELEWFGGLMTLVTIAGILAATGLGSAHRAALFGLLSRRNHGLSSGPL